VENPLPALSLHPAQAPVQATAPRPPALVALALTAHQAAQAPQATVPPLARQAPAPPPTAAAAALVAPPPAAHPAHLQVTVAPQAHLQAPAAPALPALPEYGK